MEYRLRDIPKPLWDKFKIKCINENMTQGEAILKLIGEWVAENGSRKSAKH